MSPAGSSSAAPVPLVGVTVMVSDCPPSAQVSPSEPPVTTPIAAVVELVSW